MWLERGGAVTGRGLRGAHLAVPHTLSPCPRVVLPCSSAHRTPPHIVIFFRMGSMSLSSLHTQTPHGLDAKDAPEMGAQLLFPSVHPLPSCAGVDSSQGTDRKAELASPAAFTSRGWHRAQATGSSGTHAGQLSPSHSAPGRTPSVSPCDGTSACGESNSHISAACSEALTSGQKGHTA